MKAAVYTGTRNLYPFMANAAKSLLLNSDVEKIYFLTEDDDIGQKLPPEIECINVSNQTYFPKDGPNMHRNWFTYMAYMRAVLTKIFPNIDKILSLDVDTVVEQDISDIWDIDISDSYFSACHEIAKSYDGYTYYNTGVCLYNLKKMREDSIDDKVVTMINSKSMACPEQDALTELCQGHVTEMNPSYNCTLFTVQPDEIKIMHYASIKNWFDMPEVNAYKKYDFDEIKNIRKSKNFLKTKKTRLSTTYMIHACNERMWYVNDYLVPSMKEQGIPKDDIVIWQDKDRKGNLISFIDSMKWVAETQNYLSGVWHMQDDVVIGSRFRELTLKNNDGIVSGFCNKEFDGANVNYIGLTPVLFSWFSFQCIRIPNRYAKKFIDWYENEVVPKNMYANRRAEGKHDDYIWRAFISNNYPNDMCNNVIPNFVDHIDYLIGGSLINKQRNGIRRGYWFDEPERVDELERKLKNKAV